MEISDIITILIDFGGIWSGDITDRILQVDPLHEYLNDDSGQFRISEWSCEIDNSDDFLAEYNAAKGSNTDVYVFICLGPGNTVIWEGSGPAQIFNSADNTLKFTFKHRFNHFKKGTIGPTTSPWNVTYYLDSIINAYFDSIHPGTPPDIEIDMSGFYINDPAETPYTWDDFVLENLYFMDDRINGLVVIGDLLRSFGSVIINEGNSNYKIIDRKTLLAQTPEDVTDDLLGSITEDRWDKQRNKLRLTTIQRIDPDMYSTSTMNYATGYKGVTANEEDIMSIEANMLYNLSTYIHTEPPSEDLWTAGIVLAEFVHNTFYEPWFKPGAAQTQLSFTLAGLQWYPGDAVQWDANFWVLIEETEKDLGNRKTRCTGLKVIV